jgi:glycosyltransferase involved in cell wall biosynthesis
MPLPGPADGSPEISVVIPTIGREALLTRVLERLDEQTAAAHRFEVIVAADAAHPRAGDLDAILQGRRYRPRRVQASLPGASAARNAGWRAAAAPLLLFIDDDVLPEPGLVEQHIIWHHRHPGEEVGVLGRVRWASELRVTTFMRWLDRGIQFDYAAITGIEAHWGHFYTANASVKRGPVERAGGFDEERLPFGYEDLDLALRMHQREGFRLLYNRSACAEHMHRMDLDFWQKRVQRIAASERRFAEKHPEVPPYFYDMFREAASSPRQRPQVAQLARFVPPSTPLLGPRVWARTNAFYRQALAPAFLRAWHEAGEAGETSIGSGQRAPAGSSASPRS